MRFCTHCGAQVPDNSKFCTACGTPIDAPDEATVVISDPEEELHPFEAPQNVINSQKAYHEPVYPRGWKKSEEEKE